MFTYCIVLTIMSGNFGFDGDDWWVLGWAYWHDFPSSILEYAKDFLRPVEGIYCMSMFEMFGFNRIAFHFASLTLLATSCLLMGRCLFKAFPERSSFVVLATMLAFFLPMVSCLTYVVFTDNSRVSVLLFWLAVLGFQSWGEKPSWLRLSSGICLYLLSFLTYESPSLLIFTIPLFVWPIHTRRKIISDRSFFTILGSAIFGSFGVALVLRYTLMSGGVIDAVGLTPSPKLILAYLALLPFYLVAPFTWSPEKSWPVLSGIVMTLWVIFIIYPEQKWLEINRQRNETLYIGLLGLGISFLGMAPYQIAGYGSSDPTIVDTVFAKFGMIDDRHPAWFNFNEASRIYSSASYGIAILISVAATVWKRAIIRNAAQILIAIAIGSMAVFHAGLSLDWKEASLIRNKVLRSLVAKAPSVQNGTNFIFVDLELYHKRAAVIRGWSGLRELIRMLYNDSSLGAWYVYPFVTAWPNTSHQQAIILPAGFVSRGIELDHPVPPETILIFQRQGTKLLPLNKLSSKNSFIENGISWQGCDRLNSNFSRITHSCVLNAGHRSNNPSNSGLFSSLELTGKSFPQKPK